jgi:mono/diheme cytochrome c family protein
MADLDRVIEHGVPGTSMPSFLLISEEERAILRQYVVYLAIRGQSERALVEFVSDELPVVENFVLDSELREEIIDGLLAPIVDAWAEASERIIAVPEGLAADAEAGRKLYHSERAGCAKCHGDEGHGGSVAGIDYEIDHDLWTRDRVLASPGKAIAAILRNDLPMRTSRPRKLVGESLHGGSDPADAFRRLHQGIAGTTMPAVGGAGPGESGTLKDAEVAAIVAYLQALNL